MKNKTATPYVLTAILLISGIAFAEYWLNEQQAIKRVQVIATQNTADEDGESPTSLLLQATELELAQTLLQELKTDQASTRIKNDPRLLILADDRKKLLLSYLGVTLNKLKNFNQAINILQQVSVTDRLNHNSQFSLAYSQFKTKQLDKSLTSYQQLLAFDPQHQSAALNKSLLLKRMGRCEDAINAFEYSIGISSGVKKSKAHAGLSACYQVLNNYKLAKIHLTSAIEYRPSYAKNWKSMAVLYKLQDRPYREINDLYKKAAQLDEKGHKIMLEWAEYQVSMLDFNGATQTLRKVQSKIKKSVKAKRLLAISYLESGKYNNTKKQAKKLLRLENNKHRENYAKTLLELAKGNFEAAYNISKKLPAKNLQYRYLTGISVAKYGKHSSARKIFSQLAANKKYQLRATRQLALLHKSQKNYPEAAKLYQQLSLIQPESSALWKERARLAKKQNNLQLALTYLDQGIKTSSIKGNNKSLFLAKSKILVQLDNRPGAIDLLTNLGIQHPKDLYIRKLLADNLYLNNQHAEAYSHYKLLLKHNPDDVKLLYRLANISIENNQWKDGISLLNILLEHKADHVNGRYLLAKSYCSLDKKTQCKTQAHLTLKLNKNHKGAKELLNNTDKRDNS